LAAAIGQLRSDTPAVDARLLDVMQRRIQALLAEARIAGNSAELSDRTDALIRELVTVAGGYLLRKAGVDQGLCDFADLLIAAIAGREPTTPSIVGTDDAFGPLAATVHVRFPGSVWTLPFVAHEYGHLVAFRHVADEGAGVDRRASLPVAERLERERAKNRVIAWAQLGELFADMFATWVLGPAFPLALDQLLFQDGRADEASAQHPRPSARLTACRRTLERLDDLGAAYAPDNASVVEFLERSWSARAQPTSPPASFSLFGFTPALTDVPAELTAGAEELDSASRQFLDILERDFAERRYTRSAAARQAERYLRREVSEFPGVAAKDVVDACWRARMTDSVVAAPQHASRVRALCRAVVPTWEVT
jgi:hypothetical protein